MALTNKQRVFIAEYLRCWNATDAYCVAYPKSTRDAARANGARLIANDNIADEIRAHIAERTMGADEVLVRLAEQARAEYSQYFMPNGTVDLRSLIRDGKAHLIKKIKETQWGTQVEFYDAHTAKELIGKHHGLFTDKVEHSGEIEIVDATDPRERIAGRIAGIAKRAGAASDTERPDDGGGEGS